MKKIINKIGISLLIIESIFSLVACSNNSSNSDNGDRNITEETKSAYEQYKDAHPEYTKSEAEWIQDLLNGNLGAKKEYTISFNSNGGVKLIVRL